MSPFNKDPSTGMNAALAATLRAERAVKRMTINKLAGQSGIPKRTLMRLLNAERTITVEHLNSLADALQVPIATLIERAGWRLKTPDE